MDFGDMGRDGGRPSEPEALQSPTVPPTPPCEFCDEPERHDRPLCGNIVCPHYVAALHPPSSSFPVEGTGGGCATGGTRVK